MNDATRGSIGSEALDLAVEGVAKRFGGVVASAGVSMNVPKGKIVSVIGPNGAGKTSLINMAGISVALTAVASGGGQEQNNWYYRSFHIIPLFCILLYRDIPFRPWQCLSSWPLPQ